MTSLIDTHCHLDRDPLHASVDEVLARARAAGVVRCITIGTSVASSTASVALAARYPDVYAAVGIHPHDAETVTDESLAAIEALAQAPKVVAIGEVGLDHYRNHASPAAQARAFRAFIAIAQRRHLPLLIHCRDAYDELLAMLRELSRAPVRGAIHCASGPAAFIRGALELGLHISFSGIVTFPNARAVQALVPLVPEHRLLIETDAPWLAPQPVRGQTNEPAYVAHTAACVAQLRGISIDALGALTSRNACQLLHLPQPDGATWN